MKTYIGKRVVRARKMTLREYIKHLDSRRPGENRDRYKLSWNILLGHDLETEGYLVGYTEEDNIGFNGPVEDGCYNISWSPSDFFETNYKEVD